VITPIDHFKINLNSIQMPPSKTLACLGFLVTSLIPADAESAKSNAQPITPPKPKSDWEVTGAAGLTLADGNADTLAYSLQFLATRISDIDEIYLNADYFYADDQGVEASNALRLNGQYNRLLSERFYYGFTGGYLADQVAELDYRIDTNALFGYYLWKNDQSSLAIEAGPGYSWEAQGGITDSYTSLRFS
jgi:Protein of unknown function, DUF481